MDMSKSMQSSTQSMARACGKVFQAAVIVLSFGLYACGNSASLDELNFSDTSVPRRVESAFVNLDDKVTPGTMPEVSFLKQMIKRNGRCCDFNPSYNVDDLKGLQEVKSAEIIKAVGPSVSLYLTTLPDLSDTTLIGPLFGPSPRELELPSEITDCRVIAGVRDGVLRAGMLTTRDADYGQESRCNMVAMLLLLGLPEEEALDYEKWSELEVRRGVETGVVLPRRDAINQYAACLHDGRYKSYFPTVESCP